MAKVDYQHIGSYSHYAFQVAFIRKFEKNPRYNWNAIPAMLELLRLIGADAKIVDVRWTAYMLATVMHETTNLLHWEVQAKDRKGKPLVDKQGNPQMVKKKGWLMTMAPVEEVGQGSGRRYQDPVKIETLGDGSVKVTEEDGDQFTISATGAVKKLTRGAKMGSDPAGAATKVYTDAAGTEHVYYGRGYVQLTWWSNYAKAGVAIGRGLDLLNDPDLVKNAEIAYALMSHGMRTGEGFANGHKFADFFTGEARDYTSARKMVNGSDKAAEIAKIAEAFEAILLEAILPDNHRTTGLPFIAY